MENLSMFTLLENTATNESRDQGPVGMERLGDLG